MNFTIPRWLVTASEAFVEWSNVRLFTGKRFDICRIDIVIALGGIGGAGYYWYFSGWPGAVEASALYIACCSLALVLRPL